MKKSLFVGSLLAGVVVLSACGIIRDRGDDYRKAQDLPHMQYPEGSTTVRQPHDLYPIPPETTGPVYTSKKFQAPEPKPLVLAKDAPVAAAPKDGGPENTLSRGQDGNGYPTLSITGGFNQIWDNLAQVLRDGGVKVDDRNQSLGLYYLSLPNKDKMEPFQLKVARAQNAYSLSLQKDDDTLAPQAVAATLFDKIQAKWHTSSGRQ